MGKNTEEKLNVSTCPAAKGEREMRHLVKWFCTGEEPVSLSWSPH